MVHRPSVTFVLLAMLLLTSTGLIGCDGCQSDDEAPPWRYTAERGNYEIVFPGQWVSVRPDEINPHAEVVAHRDDTLYLMVIPQQLPSFPSPDVYQLKDLALEMLEESVDELIVDRQGAVELDGTSGLTVFATGRLDGDDISYITTYAVDDDYGYQIIAFSDANDDTELFDEVDTILSRWHFGDETDPGSDDIDDEPPAPGPLEDVDGEREPSVTPP